MSENKTPENLAASVRQRLLNLARERGEVFDLVLTRYVTERLLYRLSESIEGRQFVLKGAMLFVVWTGQSHRPTRDLDLLGYGDSSPERLLTIFQNLCTMSVEPDGLTLDAASVSVKRIREEQLYEGQRIQLTAYLQKARIPLQIDVGFGDAVVPPPIELDYPTLLDFKPPRLRTYPREAVIAEKLHAMTVLGIANSRMKDFYDIWTLLHSFHFDGTLLASAVKQTFERRQTPMPKELPIALTDEFSNHPDKVQQWQAFLRKGIRDEIRLDKVVAEVRDFAEPLIFARSNNALRLEWSAGGKWMNKN